MGDDAKSTKTAKTAVTSAPVAPPGKRYSLREPGEEVDAPPEEEGTFKEFVWNSYRKEFLGRTWMSWLDITIFYIIFFLSLYSFFMFSWYISLLAVPPNEPYMNHEGAILYSKGPGLTMRPIPDRDTNGASTLILFSPTSFGSFRFWSDQLKKWMTMIPKVDAPNVTDCGKPGNPTHPTQKNHISCFVNKLDYGLCDGETDPYFGYSTGAPCILLKLNRIFAWRPNNKYVFKKRDPRNEGEENMDQFIRAKLSTLNNERVWIWCQGEHEHDKANLGPIRYYPGPYIERKYFPFLNQENYQTPFVMIKLERIVPGALISIECQAFAGNLKPSKTTGTGYLRFQISTI